MEIVEFNKYGKSNLVISNNKGHSYNISFDKEGKIKVYNYDTEKTLNEE